MILAHSQKKKKLIGLGVGFIFFIIGFNIIDILFLKKALLYQSNIMEFFDSITVTEAETEYNYRKSVLPDIENLLHNSEKDNPTTSNQKGETNYGGIENSVEASISKNLETSQVQLSTTKNGKLNLNTVKLSVSYWKWMLPIVMINAVIMVFIINRSTT